MRLFIAIQFDDNMIDILTRLQDDLRSHGVVGRFTPPENLHMTLAFIGEYGDPDQILDVMNRVPFGSFDLNLEGLWHFRDMFFARITEHPALASYVRRLRRELAKSDIPFDRKKFSPHVTLMRKVFLQKGMRGLSIEVPDQKIPVERISLFRSERGKHGMIYTELGYVESVDQPED